MLPSLVSASDSEMPGQPHLAGDQVLKILNRFSNLLPLSSLIPPPLLASDLPHLPHDLLTSGSAPSTPEPFPDVQIRAPSFDFLASSHPSPDTQA